MNPVVIDLANQMRLKRQEGDRYVLLLGPRASMSSGSEVPSVGYPLLADLVKRGFFDIALSFNSDTLLEDALANAGFSDFKTITRGVTADDEMQRLAGANQPRFKIVKLAASVGPSNDGNERHRYPPAIESLISSFTKRDIIVCGHAFDDLAINRAFSEYGGAVFSVDTGGVSRSLRFYMKNRHSGGRHIDVDFDAFFLELHEALTTDPVVTATSRASSGARRLADAQTTLSAAAPDAPDLPETTDADVFLSYRRQQDAAVARLLQTSLQQRGFSVFLDVDDLRIGHFDEALLRHIEGSKCFIVILSPGALDRCRNPDDFLRREIEHAVATQRRILPILMPEFAFPNDVVPTIKSLERHQSIEYTHTYFKAMVDQLAGYLRTS